MLGPFAVLLPLTLAGVLVASAIAKIRRPDSVDGWASLGVPAVLRRAWLVRLHPWGELALALALVVLGGVLGVLAALAAVVLMGAYLWLVAAALRRSEGASCACFGEQRPITRVTVARNVWLVLLAAAAAATIWANPLLGGAIAALDTVGWGWVAAAVVAVATAVLVMWADAAEAAEAGPVAASEPVGAPADDDDLEYIRTRTPAVPVSLADGTVVNLRRLAMSKPILLIAVSPICGSCVPVVERVPAWRPLLPEVDIRLLLTLPPEKTQWTEVSEPQSLHDPGDYVRGSISDWGTPTAVLLGIDGLLAGGPVSGLTNIEEFIGDVYESLHGVRPTEDEHAAAERAVAGDEPVTAPETARSGEGV